MNYSVSIVVPIYNVSKYVEQCAESLFKQNFNNIEYIFVDDFSPDDSIDLLQNVLKKYPDRSLHVKIIHHEKNKGLGAARKTGIANATGEYIIHIDSDDWCELDMVSNLYSKAKEAEADMVVCDFIRSYKNKEAYFSCNFSHSQLVHQMLSGKTACAVWNKLIKRSVYLENSLTPNDSISFAEDAYLMIRAAFFCKKIEYLPKAFLHYRQTNSSSITNEFSEKNQKDFTIFIQETICFFIDNGVYELYKDDILSGILSHKFDAICNGKGKDYWTVFYPDANQIKYVRESTRPIIVKVLQMIVFLNFSLGKNLLSFAVKLHKRRNNYYSYLSFLKQFFIKKQRL